MLGEQGVIPRWLRFFWLVGVAVPFAIVNVGGNIFFRDCGEPAGL